MKLRPLGRTGLQISEIVFGAGATGGAVFRGDPASRTDVVRHALDLGVNWIDTAPGYGDGQSEENLGRILAELGAQPYLSTKVRLAPDELDDVPAAVQRSLEQSLGRLRQSSVELIQLHNRVRVERDPSAAVLGVADVLGEGGVAGAFDRLREQGLARFGGFTALGETRALHQLVASGRFDTAQVYHNLLNPSAGRPVSDRLSVYDYRNIIAAAAGNGMGVLNIRVLAAGVVAGRELPPGSPAMSPGSEPGADAARAVLVAEALTGEAGTMAQRAIRFALMNRGVSGVLVGFSHAGHVDEAVAAAEMPPLSTAAMSRLDALYDGDFRGAS